MGHRTHIWSTPPLHHPEVTVNQENDQGIRRIKKSAQGVEVQRREAGVGIIRGIREAAAEVEVETKKRKIKNIKRTRKGQRGQLKEKKRRKCKQD